MNNIRRCCRSVNEIICIYHQFDDLCEIYRLYIDPTGIEYMTDTHVNSVRRRLYLIGERSSNLLITTSNPCQLCRVRISDYYTKILLLTAWVS